MQILKVGDVISVNVRGKLWISLNPILFLNRERTGGSRDKVSVKT